MSTQDDTKLPIALSEADQRQVLGFYRKIQRSRAELVGPDGKTQSLPVSLYEFLVKLTADLCEGQTVSIAQNDAQLTTVETARSLGVSGQFPGEPARTRRDPVPHGRHAPANLRPRPASKAKRDSKLRQALDELTCTEAEDGLSDLEPPAWSG